MRYSAWKLVVKTAAMLGVLALTGFYAFSSRPALRVVAHITDERPEAVEQALGEIEGLLASAAEDKQSPEIAVIATGAGVRGLSRKHRNVLRQVERLQGAGVRFAVGEDTLARLKIPDQDLPVGFIVVPSAGYEIAKLRKRRYEYFRP